MNATDVVSEDSVNNFGADHEFTKLVIDLKGKDPDDSFSSIPYEKVRSPLVYFNKSNIHRDSTSSTISRNSSANQPSTNSSRITSQPYVLGKPNLSYSSLSRDSNFS